jgi:hypothetical protein
MIVSGPCYDLLAPCKDDAQSALPEHLYWESVSQKGLENLLPGKKAGIEQAQACVTEQALASLTTCFHPIESTIGFSR